MHSPTRAGQSRRGSMFTMSWVLMSASTISSSAFLGWRGKLEAWGLQALRAQVMKLRVRSFILAVGIRCNS